MKYKGYFKPRFPEKYKGNPANIIYRSSWELKLMSYLDTHKDIIQWSSEEFFIPYRSPIDGKLHRYFPDFWVKLKNKQGVVEVMVIEVKPRSQTKPPEVQKDARSRRYLNEVKTWGINSSKWKAAKSFCDNRNWKFVIMTEDQLGIK